MIDDKIKVIVKEHPPLSSTLGCIDRHFKYDTRKTTCRCQNYCVIGLLPFETPLLL